MDPTNKTGVAATLITQNYTTGGKHLFLLLLYYDLCVLIYSFVVGIGS